MIIQFKKRLIKPYVGLKKMENFLTWGYLTEFIDNNWYVDVGTKSLVKVPKYFFKNSDIIPQIGIKIPVYISRYSDAKGQSRIDQEQVIYYFNLSKIMKLYKSKSFFEATVKQIKVSGYVLKFLPYQTMDQMKYFYGFLPNSYTYKSQLKVDDNIQVQIQILNLKDQSIILSLDSSQMMNNFDQLSVGQKVDGKVLSLTKQGAIVLVGNFPAFLSYQDFYFTNNEFIPKLKIGDNLPQLIILKKNIEYKKIYLTAKHIFDSLTNYFEINEVVDCQIIQTKNFGYLLSLKKYNDMHFKGYLNLKNSSWKNIKYIKPLSLKQNVRAKIIKLSDLKIYLSLRLDENNFWINDQEELAINNQIKLPTQNVDYQNNFLHWDDQKKRFIWILNITNRWIREAYRIQSRNKYISFIIYKHYLNKSQIDLKINYWLSIIELMRYFNYRTKEYILTLISFEDNIITFTLPKNSIILTGYINKIDNIILKQGNDYRFRIKYLSLTKDRIYLDLLS